MSAPSYNGNTGRIYFFYGGPGLPWNGAYPATSADATFTGINAGDYAGDLPIVNSYAVGGALSYGDFNADGYSDFIVGVRMASIGGRGNNGEVVLYYGRQALLSGNYLLNLTDADAIFYGENNDDQLCTLPTGMAEGVDRESILMGAYNFISGAREGKTYEMLGDEPQPPSLVPEFSITTLLFAILTAGGLVIFTVRRHKV